MAAMKKIQELTKSGLLLENNDARELVICQNTIKIAITEAEGDGKAEDY